MTAVIPGRSSCGIVVEDESPSNVLFRSTGLGKAELVGEIVAIKPQGDYLVMEVHTSEPVRWKIRGAVSFKDLRAIIKAVLKVSVIFFFFKVAAWFREPEHPGDF
jgi:hypothetical protein